MNELVCNLHIHSVYSDGTGSYTRIAEQAITSNLDVVIITDHNVKVKGVEKYFRNNSGQVLLLTGEEVHDQNRMPQKNHMLVIGCRDEVAQFAPNPQTLIDQVNACGGLTFLAHPYEYDLPLFHETDITWEDWEIRNFTGLELWNGFSEFKTVVRNFRQALFYAFNPELIPHHPLTQTLAKWDELLKNGQRIFAVGGSDSHALNFRKGIFRKTIFPYKYHFSTINNHLLLKEQLSGNVEEDKALVYKALKAGSFFIGNDLPTSTRGFSFTIENENSLAGMGEEITISNGATLRVSLPNRADLQIIHNGIPIQKISNSDRLTMNIAEPGFYRVEAFINYYSKSRGWIFSNPIFLRSNNRKDNHDR